MVLLIIAIVATFLVVGCDGQAPPTAGPTSGFNDIIIEFTPDVNVTPLSSGPAVDLDTEGMTLDQVNPISTKTTINASQAGTFIISFARFSEAKGMFVAQARCNGKPNAIGLTRPISEIPNVILRVLSSDKDSAFNCKTTQGIIIDIDGVGFIETEGTTVRVVLRADKKARIAVFSGHILLTPRDEYGSEPILIGEHTEVLVDVTERTILPPTPATFTAEEVREFEELKKSFDTTDGADTKETETPPTSTPAIRATRTPTVGSTSPPAPTVGSPSPPAPTVEPTSPPMPEHDSGHRHLISVEENGDVSADLALEKFGPPGPLPGLKLAWIFELRQDVRTADGMVLTCEGILAILKDQKDAITGYEGSLCLDIFILQIEFFPPLDSFLLSLSAIEIPTLASK
ncbi:MAG: hypothetical protein IIA92_06425 [Chloroflexi bacterium]|nr:hypothetical protein [Chloroflexota bacterium]